MSSRALIIFAAAGIAFADAVIVWIGLQADFAFDFACCYQQAGDRALTDPSSLYEWSATYTWRYTPTGALAFSPLARLSAEAAAIAWLVIKLGVLGVAAWWFSAPWHGSSQRWLVIGLVVAFPPIVHDLVIGNVSTFTLFALVAVIRWPDARGGAILGALTILAPKPHLIPILAWLAIRSPRTIVGSAASMAGGTLIGLLVFGVDPWIAFIGTLREPLERTFTANVGLSGLLGAAGVVIGLVLAAGAFALAVWRRDERGFGLAVLSGILAGPYTFIHYLAGALVAAEPVLRSRPRLLAPFPWLLVAFPLIPAWLLALAGALHLTGERPPARVAEAGQPAAARG